MKKLQRWDCDAEYDHETSKTEIEWEKHKDGAWCKAADVERLEIELDNLKAIVADLEKQRDASRRERDEMKDSIEHAKILNFTYNHLIGGEVTVASPLVAMLRTWIRMDLGDAPNFLVREFSVSGEDPNGVWESYVVTLQRRGKLTPADRYLDVCKERDALAKRIATIEACFRGEIPAESETPKQRRARERREKAGGVA